jgi:hypothetical protein
LVQFFLGHGPVPAFWWHRLHLEPVREQFSFSLLRGNKEMDILLGSSTLQEFSE